MGHLQNDERANKKEPALPQMGPSSERSAQSTLPLQILSGVRHTEVSLAQGYLGGLQMAVSQDSSSERSSQSMSPSHTQLLVIHLPVESRASSEWHQKRIYCKRRKGSPSHGCALLHVTYGFRCQYLLVRNETVMMHLNSRYKC